jgi:hypothetical protein
VVFEREGSRTRRKVLEICNNDVDCVSNLHITFQNFMTLKKGDGTYILLGSPKAYGSIMGKKIWVDSKIIFYFI